MAGMTESCSVCASPFDVQFRYQMEERAGGFSFYCSQACLKTSQSNGTKGMVACDACAKHFQVELVSNVLYLGGQRRYACSMDCRTQLSREANGARLGDLSPARAVAAPPPTAPAAPSPARADAAPPQPAAAAPPPTAPERVSSVRPREPAPALDAARAPMRSPGQPHVIAVFNHKGGTGKTTTSVSVAAGLALRGKRVLIVDTDAQGNVGVSLNVKAERTLYHVVVMGIPVADAVINVRPNLDLVASNESLAAAELYLAGRQNRDRVLSKRLDSAKSAYDVIVLDCSPSLSLMNQNALVFADSVLVPVACDYLSLVGVRQVIKTVKNVNQLLHHPVQIWGVLPTFYDARANICREALQTMREHFGERCLSPIRAAMKVKEAPAEGQTIFEYAAGSPAAEDYQRVVERVIGASSAADYPTAISA
jgi:chromosome partitioning protein